MARELQVFNEDIDNISRELEKMFEELRAAKEDIVKLKAKVADEWQSKAAMAYITRIEKEAAKIEKAIKSIKATKDFVASTSKAVTAADDTIRQKINSLIW